MWFKEASNMAKKQFLSITDITDSKEFPLAEQGYKILISEKLMGWKGVHPVFLHKGEWTRVPFDRAEKFLDALDSVGHIGAPGDEQHGEQVLERFRIASVKSAPTIPENWSSIWFSLPTTASVEGKGNSLKKFSLKVWCDLLVRDGVSLAQAKYILENRENKALLNSAFKSAKCTLSDTWKKRFLK